MTPLILPKYLAEVAGAPQPIPKKIKRLLLPPRQPGGLDQPLIAIQFGRLRWQGARSLLQPRAQGIGHHRKHPLRRAAEQ